MSKRPSFQFYPSDWRTDPGLCSVGARGLWIELLCLMHEGEPYGHLTHQGRALTLDSLARLVGESAAAVKRWMAELRSNNVFSETTDGVPFSRRMVRDEGLREVRATGGNKGAGHGHKGGSYGAKGGRPRKAETPLSDEVRGVSEAPLKPPPSSSSSSPSAVKEGSEAKASAQIDHSDPETVMFRHGVALLMESGKTESAARSILGNWKRDHGAGAVITALGAAKREAAIEPVAFIEKRWRVAKANDDEGFSIGGTRMSSPC